MSMKTKETFQVRHQKTADKNHHGKYKLCLFHNFAKTCAKFQIVSINESNGREV